MVAVVLIGGVLAGGLGAVLALSLGLSALHAMSAYVLFGFVASGLIVCAALWRAARAGRRRADTPAEAPALSRA